MLVNDIFRCEVAIFSNKNLFLTAVECPAGMVYQQCESLCVRTCDNINDDIICEGGCAEGCFCPDGEVLFEGECVNPTRCTGKRNIVMLYTYFAIIIVSS